MAEEAYSAIYEAHSSTQAAACYSDAKELLADAIGLAQALGLAEEANELSKRLDHIKSVFRSQFSQ